jgi:hypothetical protein
VVKIVLSVAVPADTVPEPIATPPSLKVTVPVGLAPVTVAVSVTEVPASAGFVPDERLVLLAGAIGLTLPDAADATLLPIALAAVTVKV